MRPSSPTSSLSSSTEPAFPSSDFSSLPVRALRERIVEKIRENRVTVIVGETGCGKSSQVPQFLLEENMEPILCTQPRRFAVVAVAKMVAKSRNCELGGEIGYHIGHSKLLSPSSKIVFKTAGVLLDEMRDKGINALNYKVIILDEVHERSVESDLVLVCVKQFLQKKHDMRVVLMSATADITRYRDYFRDLGRGERVEVLAIPSSDQRSIFQRRVLYLDKITELLGVDSEMSSDSLSTKYCSGISPLLNYSGMKPEVHKLIHSLVLHIHKNESDIEKSILIFLPTYYALEQQWYLLEPLSSSFKVHILHRSIDTEQALMAMKIWKSHRKVILATNIAESSVTIPKVAYVIDSCRSLQVFWDNKRKADTPQLSWVSKSQAEQRKGRTGRTCDGQIFRLVTKSFFNRLDDHESPAILKLSLISQVLLISCAESRAINDPRALLQKALDPPDPGVVGEALNLLSQVRALEKTSSRSRYEPTFYGQLLASFSLSFDAAVLILKFGEMGMLREGILLGILMDTQPLPIVHPFGNDALFADYTSWYFGGHNNNKISGVRSEAPLMGNLCAFQFWERIFRDKQRLNRLKELLKLFDEVKATKLLPKIEEEWCSFHNLVQSSLHHVFNLYEEILNSVHKFRPKFLNISNGLPTYYDPYEYEHTCLLKCQPREVIDALDTDDGHLESEEESRKCIAVPFVPSKSFQSHVVSEKLENVIKEIRAQYVEDAFFDPVETVADSHLPEKTPLCVYFLNGSCNRGSQCPFSHSFHAKRPSCKFFFSLKGCRNGESCVFSHELSGQSFSPTRCIQEDGIADAASLLQLFPTSEDGCVLLLDDENLCFSSNFACFYDPSKIISTTCSSDSTVLDPSLAGVRTLFSHHDPLESIISEACENPIPWSEVKCVLWFPRFDNNNENLETQRTTVRKFFEYLAIRILADALYEVRVILTMNNIKFSQLQVESLGRDSFFFLAESFVFDEMSFGELHGTIYTKKSFLVSRPISYIFDMYPPTDIQFGDYSSILNKNLHDTWEM